MSASCDGNSSSFCSVNGTPIPNISERLGQLRPSKELLEYYRKKLLEYDAEHEELVKKLERFKSTFEEQYQIQCELRQKDDEISELQKALSDLQVFLFQEREHVLRLYAENDRLKIQELDDRKKIQHLLSLTRPSDTEITYFVKDHPSNIVQRGNIRPSRKSARPHSPVMSHREKRKMMDRGPGGHKTPVKCSQQDKSELPMHQQQLILQIKSLQAQLEENAALSREQNEALLDDRKVRCEEEASYREKNEEKMTTLTDKLQTTQMLLYESTKDYLQAKYEVRVKERKWMTERGQILDEMSFLKQQIDMSKEETQMKTPGHVNAGTQMLRTPTSSPPPVRPTNMMVIKQLRSNLEQSQNMSEMYREQVIGLEDELARIREENDYGKDAFKEKTEKLTKRLRLMNERYESLEKRRTLEIEGFQNDIKMLRRRLKDVEKQLFKVTVNVGDQFDMDILQNVHQTTRRSKMLAGELHNLKSKVYGLERDLKSL